MVYGSVLASCSRVHPTRRTTLGPIASISRCLPWVRRLQHLVRGLQQQTRHLIIDPLSLSIFKLPNWSIESCVTNSPTSNGASSGAGGEARVATLVLNSNAARQ